MVSLFTGIDNGVTRHYGVTRRYGVTHRFGVTHRYGVSRHYGATHRNGATHWKLKQYCTTHCKSHGVTHDKSHGATHHKLLGVTHHNVHGIFLVLLCANTVFNYKKLMLCGDVEMWRCGAQSRSCKLSEP